ncbi:MAG: phosphopantetheine-binding protein [Caldilineaceae bacterium]
MLKTGAIGIHDNFFALGGHSLLAVQVISRVRQALAAELSLRQLFETPTVAELAGKIKEANKSNRPPIRQRLRGQHGVKRSSLTERSAQFSKI